MAISLRQLHNLPDRETFYTMVTTRNTPNCHEKLQNAVVGIAGIGGLGSNIAVHMARMGVGKLIMADFDVVDPSNLNRQHYFTRHIGMKKTDAIQEIIQQINPYIEVETHAVYLDRQNICEIFNGVDVMVEAFDRAESKSLLIDEWLSSEQNAPLVSASGMAGTGASSEFMQKKLGKKLYIVGDFKTDATAQAGLMAPRVALAAAEQGVLIMRLLLGLEE